MVRLTCPVFLGDVEWTAHFDYSRGRPACHTQRNGDPGWPADPPEVEVEKLTREGVALLSYHDDAIEQACIDYANQWEEDQMTAWYESRDRRCE